LTFEFRRRHVDAVIAAARASRLIPLAHLGREQFDLSSIAAELSHIRAEVLRGTGVVILRGFPVDQFPAADVERMWYGFGLHFGNPVSQSRMGDRLGHVIDVSGRDPSERGYRSSLELRPHTDSNDIVAMLCLRPARTGGTSSFVSGLSVHDEILTTAPALLQPLYRGFRYHWKGEQPPSEAPITSYRIPVFSRVGNVLSCCYLRDLIELAWTDLGEAPTAVELMALDCVDAVSTRADMRIEVQLQSGDGFVINNFTVLHSRTAFEDDVNAARRRHLLRLWLRCPGERPVIPPLIRFYGDGIVPDDSGGTYYTGRRL